MKKKHRKLVLLAAALAVLSGCGSGQTAEPAQVSESESEAAESGTANSEATEREAAESESAECSVGEEKPEEATSEETVSIETASGELPGVSMTLLETSRTGAVVSFLNTTDLNIEYGNDYDLQVFADGTWNSLPYLVENWAVTSMAYTMPKDQPVEWQVDWEALQGRLEPGRYRLIKPVMDFRGTGDYTNYELAAEFEIEAKILDKPPSLPYRTPYPAPMRSSR